MTDMAITFYYYGKLAWKLLIFRLLITYLGPGFGDTRSAPNCTILIFRKNLDPPSMNLNRHHYMIYLCTWYEKRKASIFLHFFGFWGLLSHQISLVKCECIYFCAKVRILIDLGEKYGTKFGLLIYYKKNVDF